MLGRDVLEELTRRGHSVTGTCRTPRAGAALTPMDITDRDTVLRVLGLVRPEAVLHCAAYTQVDQAQQPASVQIARAVNAEGTRFVAEACRRLGARMLYVSTDYVFDGFGTEPWRPDDTEGLRPLNVYGETKLAGERAVQELLDSFFIVRVSWLYGRHGRHFIRSVAEAGRTRGTVRVVCDQIGRPTYTRDLAGLLADMIVTEKYGCYHASGGGEYTSWYGLCREAYRLCGIKAQVMPVTTQAYGHPGAPRPLNSRLDLSKLAQSGFAPLPDWRDALGRYLNEEGL